MRSKEEIRAYMKRYHEAQKEKDIEKYRKRWREVAARRRAKARELLVARVREYRATHAIEYKEAADRYQAKKRAKKLAKMTEQERAEFYKRSRAIKDGFLRCKARLDYRKFCKAAEKLDRRKKWGEGIESFDNAIEYIKWAFRVSDIDSERDLRIPRAIMERVDAIKAVRSVK